MKNIVIDVACSCSSGSIGANGTSVFFCVGFGAAVVDWFCAGVVVELFVALFLRLRNSSSEFCHNRRNEKTREFQEIS